MDRHTRHKRARYTLVACYSCRTRKVKCSGEMPCKMCISSAAVCRYPEHQQPRPPSQEAGYEHRPQPRLLRSNDLIPSMPPLHNNTIDLPCEGPISSTTNRHSHIRAHTKLSPSAVPYVLRNESTKTLTNFAHVLHAVEAVTGTSGLIFPEQSRSESVDDEEDSCWPLSLTMCFSGDQILQNLGYPICLQLLSFFETEIYPMYPCVDVDFLEREISAISQDIRDPAFLEGPRGPSDVLKAVLAIALLFHPGYDSPLRTHLTSNIGWSFHQAMTREKANTTNIEMSFLVALYFFYQDKLILAWRIISFACNSCIELGLHKAGCYQPAYLSEPRVVPMKILFACVLVLDRRCALATNLPSHFSTSCIDSEVIQMAYEMNSGMADWLINNSQPVSLSFLSAMISIDHLNTEVVTFLDSWDRIDGKSDDTSRSLEIKISHIQRDLLPTLKMATLTHRQSISSAKRMLVNLRALLRIRCNQIRLVLLSRHLVSDKSGLDSSGFGYKAMELATDTIKTCSQLHQSAEMAESVRSTYAFFVLSASSFMLLAASRERGSFTWERHIIFNHALDMVENFNMHVYTPDEEFYSVDRLREVARELLMQPLVSINEASNVMFDLDFLTNLIQQEDLR